MEPKLMDDKFTKIYTILWCAFLVIGIVVIILYKSGYRLSNNLTPIKAGSIEISYNEPNLQIFHNNREKKFNSSDKVYLIPKVTPGIHSIIVDKNGFWPWTKSFSVVENEKRKIYVFTFPTSGIKTADIEPKSDEYKKVALRFRNENLPEMYYSANEMSEDQSLKAWIDEYAPHKKMSFDKSTALYIDNGTIYIAWVSETEAPPHYFCQQNSCKLKIPLIIPNEEIKSVDFYKDRNDVILFASNSSIYAIEADSEGTQNFQPIYRGIDPYFIVDGNDKLFIKDQNTIKSATL